MILYIRLILVSLLISQNEATNEIQETQECNSHNRPVINNKTTSYQCRYALSMVDSSIEINLNVKAFHYPEKDVTISVLVIIPIFLLVHARCMHKAGMQRAHCMHVARTLRAS